MTSGGLFSRVQQVRHSTWWALVDFVDEELGTGGISTESRRVGRHSSVAPRCESIEVITRYLFLNN